MDGTQHAEYGILQYIQDSNEGFDSEPFNEVDGLVLSQVSNLDLGQSGIDLYSGESKTISEIYYEMTHNVGSPANDAYNSMGQNERNLIEAMASSDRYKDMVVSNYVRNPATGGSEPVEGFTPIEDYAYLEQFSAATITYKQNGETYNYVSYQPTDASNAGWSEDMAMLALGKTQAQSDAKAYMNIVGSQIDGYIVGGGHSKGGNDFEYAYLFCDDSVRRRIVKGYIYDSPGLDESVLAQSKYYDEFQKIVEGTHFCPQDSTIGVLLHQGENPSFIHSVESNFLEHDPYSWSIDPNTRTFVPDEQTEFSKRFDQATDIAVKNMSQEEREALFHLVTFYMYNNGSGKEGIEGITESFDEPKKALSVLLKYVSSLPKKERKEFFHSLGVILASLTFTALDITKDYVEQWLYDKLEEFKNKTVEFWESVVDRFNEMKEQVQSFFTDLYESIAYNLRQLAEQIKSLYIEYQSIGVNPFFTVDTYKLRSYAQRLQAANRRIASIDNRLNSLYSKVGLLDLWNLLKADIFTGYSLRLVKCASYLNETANDFDSAESDLIDIL